LPNLAQHAVEIDGVITKAEEFVLIPTEEGVLIDGGRKLEVLRGPLAISLLPILIPLLDGTRTFSDLLALTPNIPRAHTQELVGRMIRWGILKIGNGPLPPPEMRNTLSYLTRYDARIDINAARNLLMNKHIIAVCDKNYSTTAGDLLEALHCNGFRHLEMIEPPDFTPTSIRDDAFAISIVEGDPSSVVTREFYEALNAASISWLRTTINIACGIGEIGPLFYPDSALCLKCLTREQRSSIPGVDLHSRGGLAVWSAILASEITAELLNVSKRGPRSFYRYSGDFRRREVKTWPAASTCTCSIGEVSTVSSRALPGALGGSDRNMLPFHFEEMLVARSDEDESVDHDWLEPRAAKRLTLNSAQIPLPRVEVPLQQQVVDVLISEPRVSGSQLDLAKIATLLALSVGFREKSGNTPRRWAPSGGNLGSVEAYLVANCVPGLRTGVYLYKAEQHALAQLNQRDVDHVQAALGAMRPNAPCQALLVFASSYKRIARKYGPFAYKLLHLDAGAASSQLLLVSTALGLSAECAEEWSEGLMEQALALRPPHEVCTQVFRLALQPRASSGSLDRARFSRSLARSSDGALDVGSYAELPSHRLIDELIRSKRTVSDRLPIAIRTAKRLRMIRLLRRISGASRCEETLGHAFNRRTSVRHFSDRALCKSDIVQILQVSLANDVLVKSHLAVTVLIQRSIDCEPGVYRFNNRKLSLSLQRDALSRDQFGQIFLQEGYEDTPLTVWISGDVRKAAHDREGGYESLLVRAGVLGHRLWMASLGLGLCGVLLAGIRSDVAKRSDYFTEMEHASLLAFLCGYAETEGGGSSI
jgi:SagB-type dehydrogenase family enzyme